MIWLVPGLLLSFGFGQLFKLAQRRGCYAPAVVSANYLTTALLLLFYHLLAGRLDPAPLALEVGVFTGITFIGAMLLMTRGLEFVAVGAVLTSFRLAILIPIWASVYLWGESLSPVQFGGIALSLVALVLMTRGGTSGGHLSPSSVWGSCCSSSWLRASPSAACAGSTTPGSIRISCRSCFSSP